MPMCITDTPQKAFDKLSIDTIGPMTTTSNGNKYALTALCDLSKYLIIVPIQNKESYTVARALVENIFLNYGTSHTILTDMGTEYVNKLLTDVNKILNIDHKKSTPYHPQTVGGVERSHRTLNEYLKINLRETNIEWDSLVKYFSYCYNIAPHSSFDLKYSPFELTSGRKPNSIDILKDTIIDPIYNIHDYAKELKFNLQNANVMAREFLIKSKEINKNQYDKKLNNIDFKINDKVLLLMTDHTLYWN